MAAGLGLKPGTALYTSLVWRGENDKEHRSADPRPESH